jgi:DNA polymerase III delta prime subunit
MMTHTALLVLTQDDQMSAVLDVINQTQNKNGLAAIPAAHPNIQWLATTDAPISIELVRQLLTSLAYSHATPHYYCFLYANQLTLPAQNALLKSLEEPPENVTIILSCVAAESV